jgi:hypothetical protein
MKNTLITQHLTTQGLLKSGDPIEIAAAKEKFWAERRKNSRALERKTQKSVQLFFSVTEHTLVSQQSKKMKLSITRFAKESVLHASYYSDGVYSNNLLEFRKLCFQLLEVIRSPQEDENGIKSLEPVLVELQKMIIKLVSFNTK